MNNIQVPEGYIERLISALFIKFEKAAQIRISHIMIDKNNYESSEVLH